MSKTPRTDEHLRMKEENGHTVIVSSEFARQLETELADARAEIERKDALIEQVLEALRLALPEARSTHVEQAIIAALAAGVGE